MSVLPGDPEGRDSVRGRLQLDVRFRQASGRNWSTTWWAQTMVFRLRHCLGALWRRCRSARFRSRMEGMRRALRFLRASNPAQGPPLGADGLLQQQQTFQKASGRGGQPGTYTSTGRNLSTPCTTL